MPADSLAALRASGGARRASMRRRIDEDCLQLYAGTDAASPLIAALHEAALAAQPSMGYPGAKYQAGIDPLDVIEVAAARAGQVMGANFAEVRPTSATLANLAIYTALAQPGTRSRCCPTGPAATSPTTRSARRACAGCTCAAAVRHGARSTSTSTRSRSSSTASSRSGRRRREPDAVPHRLTRSPRPSTHGFPLLYDASHVAGLIAEGRFQAPLATAPTSSPSRPTSRSAARPAARSWQRRRPDGARADRRLPRPDRELRHRPPLPLGAAALQHDLADGAYADACIANARALAAALRTRARRDRRRHRVTPRGDRLRGRRRHRRGAATWPAPTSSFGDRFPGRPRRRRIRIGTQSITRQGSTTGRHGRDRRRCARARSCTTPTSADAPPARATPAAAPDARPKRVQPPRRVSEPQLLVGPPRASARGAAVAGARPSR